MMKRLKNRHKLYHYLLCVVLCIGCNNTTAIKENEDTEERIKNVLKENIPEISYTILKKGVFPQEILSNGTITARNKADIKWGTSDVVLKILVKNGDRVEKGQLLAEVDQEQSLLSFRQAEASRQNAHLEMQDFLIGQGYRLADSANIPSDMIQLASIKSGYAQAEISYQKANITLRETSPRAPFSGIIANLETKPYNKGSIGERFCTILDNSHMEAVFSVMENEVKLLRHNEPVIVSLYAQEDEKRTGQITDINPIVSENGFVQVKATIANTSANWFDGMKVLIKIRKNIPDKLVVPKEAVVIRDNRQVVFTIKDGRAYWNYVSIDTENSNSYAIESGISEGDSVIVKGNLNLAHLSPIIVSSEI